jgi:hypothetical protein
VFGRLYEVDQGRRRCGCASVINHCIGALDRCPPSSPDPRAPRAESSRMTLGERRRLHPEGLEPWPAATGVHPAFPPRCVHRAQDDRLHSTPRRPARSRRSLRREHRTHTSYRAGPAPHRGAPREIPEGRTSELVRTQLRERTPRRAEHAGGFEVPSVGSANLMRGWRRSALVLLRVTVGCHLLRWCARP